MLEFLIRTAETHEWPAFHSDQLAAVFAAPGSGCVPIEGWGDFRVRWQDSEISFSGEEVGWQVTIEGSPGQEDAATLIDAMTRRVESATGEPCEWIQIA